MKAEGLISARGCSSAGKQSKKGHVKPFKMAARGQKGDPILQTNLCMMAPNPCLFLLKLFVKNHKLTLLRTKNKAKIHQYLAFLY